MAAITTGSHPKALWPGLHAWWGLSYNKHPLEWSQCFDVKDSSDKAYEEDVEGTGFGLAPVKSEGTSISYDAHTQGPTTRYTHVVYGLGFIVTEEEESDNLYDKLSRSRAESLAFSMRTTKEIVHANIFNRAFNSSYTGGDGLEMCSTAHVTVDGTQSNELATAADFSEASLEDMLINIAQAKNTRGLEVGLMGRSLVVPPALMFEAQRVLHSELRVGTANNDINAVKSMGLLPDGWMVNHYLTDSDAWFIKTNAPNGLTHFKRKALDFAQDSDFDTSNKKHKATERYSAGWTDWRGVYGTPGA
jgi:hypothetical protein